MSLAKLKAKETKTKIKSKVKPINKVKVFLANPFKLKSPSLEDDDFQQLQQLLQNAVKESNQTPRTFATTAHICLGLESSLRAVNNSKAACVFLSSNIKPRYILRLFARNVEVKNDTAPTYVEKELEDVTKRIFGVRALAMVLPKENKAFGAELIAWIEAHKKPKVNKVVQASVAVKKRKPHISVQSPSTQLKTLSMTSKPNEEEINEEMPIKPWGSDYISFGEINQNMDVDEVNDEDKLLTALGQIAEKAKQQKPLPSESTEPIISETNVEAVIGGPIESDEDDFLSSYAPLKIHKICPNPDQKPKKKRKKNRNAKK